MKKSFLFIASVGISLPILGMAQISGSVPGGGSVPVSIPNPLSCNDLNCVFIKIIDGLLKIAIPLVAIMVLYAGFQMLTAGGDEKKYSNGKQTLKYAVIGFAIILISKGVTNIIIDIFR